MALALDGSVVVTGASAAAVTSTARDVAANRGIWAFVTHNNSSAATITTAVTNNGGLTFALERRQNTQQGTCAEIWRAYTSGSLTGLTVTGTGNNGGTGTLTRSRITVAVFSDEEETAGGAVNGASNASGLPSAAVTTTQDGSWVWAVKSDWSAGGVGTPGSNQTQVDGFDDAEYASSVWRQTDLTATSGTNVTMNETAPSAQNYNIAVVEIRSTGAAPPQVQWYQPLQSPERQIF